VALGQKAETIGSVDKILRWYWCGVLGELYGGALAYDLVQVIDWVCDRIYSHNPVHDPVAEKSKVYDGSPWEVS
jgi:hypothetical protein